MKKIVATLLFFIFANSFFAPVFSASNVVKQMSLNITDSAFDNLKSAAKFFKEQVDFLCGVEKDKDADIKKDTDIKKDADICKKGIPNTQDILKESFSKDKKNDTDFQKKFFEVVVGFYNELNDYKISLNKINSETEIAVKTQQLLVKSTIGKLIEKLNKERETLNEVNALFNEKAKEYKDLTDLNWKNVEAVNDVTSGLQRYRSDDFEKYREGKKIELHDKETYAGLDDVEGLLEQKYGESLDDWLTRIEKLKTSLKNEEIKTQKNIDALNAIKSAREKERADAFKNCQDELLNYVKPDQIKDLFPPIKNLSDCQDRLKSEKKTQETEIQNIINLFKDLIDRNSLIEDFERAIWAKDNVWLETKNNDLKEMKDDKKYLPFGYNPETKSISCTDGNFGKDCPKDIINIALKWDTVEKIGRCLEDKSEVCLNVIPTNQLASWITYIKMAIERADRNIPVLKGYIEYKQKDCKNTLYWGTYVLSQSDTVPTFGINKSNIKTTDKTTLVEEVKECKTQQTESKCQEFANILNKKTTLKSLFEKVSLPSDVSENCVKNINEKVCSGYAKLSFGEKFSVANLGLTKSSDEMKENYGSYLEECKNKVDAKVKADSIDAAKKKLDLQCLSGDEKAKNDMLIKFDNLAKNQSVDDVKNIIQKAIADECLKRSINAEVEKCNEKSGTQKSGTQKMIEYYAIVNGKPNYTSVEDVKNKCFETFKNKCSNKDYKWNLTYENMTSELKKCEDEAGPKKCNDHIAEVEKVLGVGAKVDTTGWTWLNKAPECYKKSDEKICADYQKDLKDKLNFTFVDIKDANNTVNVKNCKAMVDKVRNEMNAALNACPELKDKNISEFKNVNEIKDMCAKVKALNACPELKGKKATDFKTVKDVNDACEKAKVENAVKMCNEMANDYKSKNETSFISADVKNYSDVNAVEKACFDKVKKLCDDSKYGDKKYVWSNLTFDNMISQLNACLGNIASLKKAEDEAKKLMDLKKIQDLSEKVVCQAYKLSRKYGTSTQSGIGMGARYNNSATSRNDKYEYDVYAEKRTSVVNNVRLDDYTQIVYDYCKSSGGIDPIIQNTKDIKECKSLGDLSNYVHRFLYYEVQFKCGKDTSVGNNWGKICRNARAIYEGCN